MNKITPDNPPKPRDGGGKRSRRDGLQKLCARYNMDGQLSVDGNFIKKYIDDFDLDNKDYID